MRRFGAILAGAVAVTLALATAGVTLAKGENVVATLDEPLPVDPAAGTTVRIAWTLTMTFDDGSVHPFLAERVFVRLSPAAGAPAEVPALSDRDGHFVATISVPKGGLGTIAIGLQGTACVSNGSCTRADEFFRIASTARSAGGAVVGGAGTPAIQPSAGPVAAPVAPVAAPVATFDAPAAAASDAAAIVMFGALAVLLLVVGLSLRARSRPAAA